MSEENKLTSESIETLLNKFAEDIKSSESCPDMYYTTCKNCGQAVIVRCVVPVINRCPACKKKGEEDE